jgi:hypothetical protein
MGPRAVLNGCGKYYSHRDSITGPSNPYRVAITANLSPGLNIGRVLDNSGVPRIFFSARWGGGGGGSTHSVVDREQRERGSGGGSLLVSGSAQFTNE